MNTYGLIGFPLTHSYSKDFFSEKFNKVQPGNFKYDLFPVQKLDNIRNFIESNSSICGLNVTTPHKESIISYLDETDPVATEIGAVNVILVERENRKIKLTGFNTDAPAFAAAFAELAEMKRRSALILGTGGAALAVQYALKHSFSFHNIRLVSRTPENENEISYETLYDKKLLEDYSVIINATPVGMFPEIHIAPPFPFKLLTEMQTVIDLIYNPQMTTFLKNAETQGCSISNGLEMFRTQAELSWKIWSEKY